MQNQVLNLFYFGANNSININIEMKSWFSSKFTRYLMGLGK